uniref:Uncharacterized protein n=1 Tax=Timema genevievae TaxID=629358 RepID=A0A7R9PPZ6_TIMGE|nr:unnamed protein product [Timema genevievae]
MVPRVSQMAAMTVSTLLVVMCLVSPPSTIDAAPEHVISTPDKVSTSHEHGSLSSFFRSVPEKVQELPHRIQEGFKELPGKIKEGFKGVPERIAEGFKAVPKRVQEAFDGAVDGAKEMLIPNDPHRWGTQAKRPSRLVCFSADGGGAGQVTRCRRTQISTFTYLIGRKMPLREMFICTPDASVLYISGGLTIQL